MALIETHLFSEILGMDTTVNLVLPQEKQPYSYKEPLKILWLLHGASGDEWAWLLRSCIERYAQEYGLAVVLPNAFNSCYTDMAHGERFFSYMTEELPLVLRHFFPQLSAKREDNYISGLSNGGYGSFRVGLARPDLYGAIGAFSAGDKSDAPFINDGSKRSHNRILLFGDGEMKNTDNDLKYLGREALKKEVPLPRVYHACGDQDPWLDLNHLMRDFFTGLKGNPYNYQYHEAKGHGHTWEFWDLEILRFFEFLELKKSEGRFIQPERVNGR